MREADSGMRDVHQRSVREKYALELVTESWAREKKGLETYGPFCGATDTRCLSREAIEEAIDAFNYMTFLRRKRPDLGNAIEDVQRKTLDLYIALRRLESEERRDCGRESHPQTA